MKITDAKQISTKTGDEGFSKNLANETLPKDDLLFDTLGTLDELDSILGLCFHYSKNEFVKEIQKNLQTINTGIAFNPKKGQNLPVSWNSFGLNEVHDLEIKEQELLNQKPLETRFTLPGSEGSIQGAYFDWARTVTRRAERVLVRFVRDSQRVDLGIVLKYLNRLSDLLYILAKNS